MNIDKDAPPTTKALYKHLSKLTDRVREIIEIDGMVHGRDCWVYEVHFSGEPETDKWIAARVTIGGMEKRINTDEKQFDALVKSRALQAWTLFEEEFRKRPQVA